MKYTHYVAFCHGYVRMGQMDFISGISVSFFLLKSSGKHFTDHTLWNIYVQYHLSNVVKLPKHEDILSIPDNKKQLIDHICDDITFNVKFQETTIGSKHRLTITVEDDPSLDVTDEDCTC